MSLPRLFNKLLLRPEDLPPSREDLRVVGVFNPGAVKSGDRILLLVRVAEAVAERRPGMEGLPRWDPDRGELTVDWFQEEELERPDPRLRRVKAEDVIRLAFISHLRLVELDEGKEIRRVSGPLFVPETPFEEYGVEDPRITPLDGRFQIAYVAVSRHGAATALAATDDFQSFERRGIIFPPENKDVALFPERVGGAACALHRPTPMTRFSAPEMWIARSEDLVHWGGHQPLAGGGGAWEAGRVGGGAPPWRVSEGWLTIYHGNERVSGKVGRYAAGAMLLDLENPSRVLGRSEAIMVPEQDFERKGFLPNIVFPTGAVPCDDTALIYYGAADCFTAVAEFRQRDLLNAARSAPQRLRRR